MSDFYEVNELDEIIDITFIDAKTGEVTNTFMTMKEIEEKQAGSNDKK